MNSQIDTPTRKVLHRKLHHLRILGSSMGCAGGIGLVGYLASVVQNVLLIPPFGATCVIAMVTPDSAFAQPRSIIGGHLLCSTVGLLCATFLGVSWWSFAIAIGLSAALMQFSRTLHPPAAADPIFFIMQGNTSGNFILMPVLVSSIILVGFFYICHKWMTKRHYPRYWY